MVAVVAGAESESVAAAVEEDVGQAGTLGIQQLLRLDHLDGAVVAPQPLTAADVVDVGEVVALHCLAAVVVDN